MQSPENPTPYATTTIIPAVPNRGEKHHVSNSNTDSSSSCVKQNVDMSTTSGSSSPKSCFDPTAAAMANSNLQQLHQQQNMQSAGFLQQNNKFPPYHCHDAKQGQQQGFTGKSSDFNITLNFP